MSKSKIIFISFFILFVSHIYSQTKISEVHYKVRSIQDVETIKDPQAKAYLIEIYEGFNLLEYSLIFNKEESLFKEIKKMDSDYNNGSFISSISQTMAFTGVVYTNKKSDIILHQKELSSNVFILKQNLQNLNWSLSGESKKVGNYNCFKATLVDTVLTVSGMTPKRITAWYAPSLPYTFGPTEYGAGLPGLVLELVINQNIVFYADNIYLNKFGSDYKIESPKKGKIVSKEELIEIEKKGFQNYIRN